MSHHRRVPHTSHVDERESTEFNVHSAEVPMPVEKHTSGEVEKSKQETRPEKKGENFLDYKIAGFPWPFVVVLLVIAIGVLGLVLKAMGMF